MTSITAYGGVDEIGGNRIAVKNGKSQVFLDFGTSFGHHGQFFHKFLGPRKVNGLGDWLEMGLCPDIPGLYRQDYRERIGRKPEAREAEAVILSHSHIDHAGLFPLLRPDIPLVMSPGARLILQTLEDTGQEEYLSYFEEFRTRTTKTGTTAKLTRATAPPVPRPVVTKSQHDVDGFTINGHDIDHSLPGARGYIVETPDTSIAYTGDFRFHGRNSHWSKTFGKKAAGVDVLITEGTNIGDGHGEEGFPELISETQVMSNLAEAIEKADGFVAAGYPNRDLDRIISFWEAAKKTGRRLLLTPKQAYMLDLFAKEGLDVPELGDRNLGIYYPRRGTGAITSADADSKAVAQEYEDWSRAHLERENVFHSEAVRKEPRAFITNVDLYNLTQLIDLRPKDGIYLYSKTEPFNEDMKLDYDLTMNWLKHFRLELVKAHASGHASEEELFHLIDEARPKKVIPVHTHHVAEFASRLGSRAVVPKLGQEIQL
jgi:ribonuclease J